VPDENTRADSLDCLLTGAASNGGAQTDPDDSIGNYRSATIADGLSYTASSLPSNITVDFVADKNGAGSGTLSFPTSDTVKWTPPDGTQGAAVTIANGETKIVEGGGSGEESKFVKISRTSATALSGTATLTLSEEYNNVFGLDNVTSAEATAGDDEYRCVCYRNANSVDLSALKFWIGTLGTQMTTSTAQLGASGAGTIEGSAGDFADWPDTGFAHIKTSGGATREIVYYSSRTDDVLTVPAAGREMLGTSAAAGASDDTADAVPVVRMGYEWGAVGSASFTGSGLDDATYGGGFRKDSDKTIRVEIDGTGTPDTFKWSQDGGSTWEETTVSITGSAQTLGETGVTVTFGATTGHTSGDYWDSACTATATDNTGADEDTEPSGMSWDTGCTAATGLDIGTLRDDEQVFVWLHREVPAGAEADPSWRVLIERQFDAA
jgi:hypothetical protein